MKCGKSYKNRLLAILLIIAIVMTGIPVQNVYAAQKKSVTVTTQKSLEKALKNKKVTQITIKTSKTATFKIKEGNYISKKLIVKAPKAKVNNYAKVKSVTVKDAKKYMEYASDNNILIEDKSLTVGVEKEATVKHLNVKAKNANNKVVIKGTVDKLSVSAKKEKLTISNSGTIKKMNISQLADISIKGTSKKAINVTTSVNAKNTILKSSIPVSILAKADINIQLNKGAESSTVILKNKANAVIKNKTKEVIMIETADGEKLGISAGVTINTKKLNSENASSNSIPLTGIEVYVENGMNTTILMQEGNYYKALIEEGNKAIFGVRVTPANATNKEVIWISSDTSIATIDENGMVTGIKKGTVTITAISKENNNIKGTFLVNITNKYPDAIHIKIENGKSSVILEKSQLNLTVTTEPVTASNEVVWSSSNTNIATVDENGVVTGVKKGTVTITATSKEDSSVKGTITITVTSNKILPTAITINVKGGGDTVVLEKGNLKLEAIVSPDNATNKEVKWSSSNTSIATVDENGVVTGIKKGTVTITATSKEDSGIKGRISITVTSKKVAPTFIIVNVKDGANAVVVAGSQLNLEAIVSSDNATNKEVKWSSSDKSKAMVDGAGVVTGVKKGTVTITATSKEDSSVRGTITITIISQKILPTAITVNVKGGGNATVVEGSQLSLEAIVSPDNATNKGVLWTSSDTRKAIVDQNGFVTGIKEGIVIITATSKEDGITRGTITVSVTSKKVAPTAITVNVKDGENATVVEQSQLSLEAIVSPNNATNKEVKWSSSDNRIAIVNENGVVTGIKEGIVIITATSKEDNTVKGTITLSVTSNKILPTAITINVKGEGNATVVEQSQLSLEAIVSPSNATNKEVVWSSSDNDIAVVNETGTVTGVQEGTATITAISKEDGTVKGECVVVVTEKEILPIAIEIYVKYGGEALVQEGSTLTLATTVTPYDATNKEVKWSSSDNSIATVDETGIVTGIKKGTVTIVATSKEDNNVKGTITLNVTEIMPTAIEVYIPYAGSLILKKEFIQEGSTLALETTITPYNTTNKEMIWSSSDISVATVDGNGVVTGVKKGNAIITATSKADETVKGEFNVIVESNEETVSGREKLATEAAQSIINTQGINNLQSDIEKVKAVHDYLVLNTVYDYENYQNNTVPFVSYEAYGVLVLKTGVCDGYRKAFQLFMDILGIPCEGVVGTGNGGAHAWNIVTLDGERYHIDVTWDDPVPDTSGSVHYNYFLVDDDTMRQDHTWNYSSKQPCNGTRYRTYPYEVAGQMAQTQEEVNNLIKKQYEEGTPEQFDIKILAKADVLESYYEINEYLWKELGVTGTLWHYPSVQVGDYYYHHVFKKVGE